MLGVWIFFHSGLTVCTFYSSSEKGPKCSHRGRLDNKTQAGINPKCTTTKEKYKTEDEPEAKVGTLRTHEEQRTQETQGETDESVKSKGKAQTGKRQRQEMKGRT